MSSLNLGSAHLDAAGTRAAFGALSDDLVAEGLPPIRVLDGDRDPQDQIDIFTARYRQQKTGSGPYGDVRYWDGAAAGFPGGDRWVRISSAGTVAVPGSSNHGKKRSGDLAAPYNANTAAHRRAQVVARRHNITCEGLGFKFPEWWHWTYWGPLGQIGLADGGSKPFIPKEWDEMASEEEFESAVRRASGQKFVKVTRDDAPLFALVGRGGTVNPVPTNEFALKGVDKILKAFDQPGETPTVQLSGQEWDAGALRAFGVDG